MKTDCACISLEDVLREVESENGMLEMKQERRMRMRRKDKLSGKLNEKE